MVYPTRQGSRTLSAAGRRVLDVAGLVVVVQHVRSGPTEQSSDACQESPNSGRIPARITQPVTGVYCREEG
jgi:hypothetical protein